MPSFESETIPELLAVMPFLLLVVGIIAVLGGAFLLKNDVGQFGVPIFLGGLLCCAIGVIALYFAFT